MTDYPPGWTCEVVALRLERYRLGSLPLGESLAIAEHLEACVVCFQRLAAMETGAGAEARRRG
jgi:hypothetical protein